MTLKNWVFFHHSFKDLFLASCRLEMVIFQDNHFFQIPSFLYLTNPSHMPLWDFSCVIFMFFIIPVTLSFIFHLYHPGSQSRDSTRRPPGEISPDCRFPLCQFSERHRHQAPGEGTLASDAGTEEYGGESAQSLAVSGTEDSQCQDQDLHTALGVIKVSGVYVCVYGRISQYQ